ncbi:unnamed protein product, partial [Symbiodinium microadriaticum]
MEHSRTRPSRKRKQVEYLGMDSGESHDKDTNGSDRKGPAVAIEKQLQKHPRRNSDGEYIFSDYPSFRPNMSPEEVLRAGSFGGTYFRPIYSSVTHKQYKDEAWKELPSPWLEGIDIKTLVTSKIYRKKVNTYQVECGQGLEAWEKSGWITEADPYGWFQWYCRFFQGRRCSDDDRQIARGLGVMGPTGRWRSNLAKKCLQSSHPMAQAVDDMALSPKVRQLLQ